MTHNYFKNKLREDDRIVASLDNIKYRLKTQRKYVVRVEKSGLWKYLDKITTTLEPYVHIWMFL
jgi:hypothetical protein